MMVEKGDRKKGNDWSWMIFKFKKRPQSEHDVSTVTLTEVIIAWKRINIHYYV